jgi:hypothetical protein
MSSGGKQMVINTQERAVSTDINRLQAFQGAADGESWRALQNTYQGADDADGGGLYVPRLVQGNPSYADVHAGLQVQPQIGNLNLIVSAGFARLYDPDAVPSTDDSQYKLVQDPGVVTVGSLVMTANASGSTRIDVIECQRSNVIVETDSRDIFNPVTGLFAATTVTKATQSLFTYRVRLGTPGSGWPGTQTGWMPLAVASVPTGTTTNDQITFWDVRPLVSNRIHQPHNLSSSDSIIDYVNGFLDCSTAAHPKLGYTTRCSASDFIGTTGNGLYRLGGYINDPGSFAALDVSSSNYQMSALGTGPVYIYLAEPFGLPRWAWYSSAAFGSRVVRSPKGVLILSTTPPLGTGTPSTALTLPPSLGFASTTGKAICIAVTHATANAVDGAFFANNKTQFASKYVSSGNNSPIFTASAGTIASPNATFAMVSNTNYPPNARALIVEFNLVVSTTFAADPIFYLFNLVDSLGNSTEVGQASAYVTSATNANLVCTLRIPWGASSGTPSLAAKITGSTATLVSATAQVIGWEL